MALTTPKRIDENIKRLLQFLSLSNSYRERLKLTKTSGFKPEPHNCHVNNLVQCQLKGGSVEYGWLIWQNEGTGFTEAEFHSIWINRKGERFDITPRIDGEKKVLFVHDPNRTINILENRDVPTILTYDNVRMWLGRLPPELCQVMRVLNSKLIDKFGLFSDKQQES